MDVSVFYETGIQADCPEVSAVLKELENMRGEFWRNELDRIHAIRLSIKIMNKDIRQAFDCLCALYFEGLEVKRDAYEQVRDNPGDIVLIINQMNEDIEKVRHKQQVPLELLRDLDLNGVSAFVL